MISLLLLTLVTLVTISSGSPVQSPVVLKVQATGAATDDVNMFSSVHDAAIRVAELARKGVVTEVELGAGVHRLQRPLELNAQHSTSVWRAAAGAEGNVIVSGGVQVGDEAYCFNSLTLFIDR